METITADGTGERPVAQIPGSQTQDIAWSPDGRQIAFSIEPEPPGG